LNFILFILEAKNSQLTSFYYQLGFNLNIGSTSQFFREFLQKKTGGFPANIISSIHYFQQKIISLYVSMF